MSEYLRSENLVYKKQVPAHPTQEYVNSVAQRPKNQVFRQDVTVHNQDTKESLGDDYEYAVFISYAWEGESERIVCELEQAFNQRGIHVLRDKNYLSYKSSIKEFEHRIGQGQCIILVISDKYLRSEHCMYEMLLILKNKNFCERIVPLVLDDASIFNAIDRVSYIQYWQNEIQRLKDEISKLGSFYKMKNTYDDLDKYKQILDSFDELSHLVSDMNIPPSEMHVNNNFSAMIDAVEEVLSEKSTI
ncbi:MAG: toll/interleukin-1 receptor domain-containing protein [Anaerolineales bacterium]|nr:toll/interleukin-1 receptor domain-containing protein [Anaerolineales bacterium]